MSKRMMVMVALLLGIGLLLVLDRPQQSSLAEVSAPIQRPAFTATSASALALQKQNEQSIPDLFAPASKGVAGGADVEAFQEEDEGGEAKGLPFTLFGFKEEDGIREALLLQKDEVVVARVGTILDKRYLVLALQKESVRIRDKTSGKEIQISFEVIP